ncbi:hypothetical protein BDR07DRAFT_1380076 [Suillus spraguei]|nr:hypothetical protein BDR07DRAFT_1380076 [Suillus spraguei]
MSSQCQADNISLSRVTYCPRDHHTGWQCLDIQHHVYITYPTGHGGNAIPRDGRVTQDNQCSMMSMYEIQKMHGQSPQGDAAEQVANHCSVTSQCMDSPLREPLLSMHGQSPQGDAAEQSPQAAVAEQEPLLIPAYHVHQYTVNLNSSTKGNSLSPTEILDPRLGTMQMLEAADGKMQQIALILGQGMPVFQINV